MATGPGDRLDAGYLRRKSRRMALAFVFAAVAAVVLWVAVDSWAESNKQRAIATFAPVVGTVTDTDGESGRIYASYEYGGAVAEQAFHVGSAGNYEPGGSAKLLVNPRNPSEAYLRTEKYDFLPGPLPMLEPILGPGAVIAILVALGSLWDCRRKSRVLAQYPIPTLTIRKPLSSRAVVPDSDESRRPSAQQIREIAAGTERFLVDRNAPLTAQPVLLVHRSSGLIWLPDGSVAGAVRGASRGTGRAGTFIGDFWIQTIVDRDEQVVVSLEAPYRLLEGRGLVPVTDGAGQGIGVIEEKGRFRRELHLVAGITRHEVDVPGRRFPTSVLLVGFAPADGPLRTMVFANAVTALTTLVPTWGNGG